MKHKKNPLEFRKSMYLLYTIAILIPIILISAFFSVYYSVQGLRQHEDLVHGATEITSQNIRQQVTELERILFTPYLYNEISTGMRWMRNGFVEEAPAYLQVNKTLEQYALMFIKLLYTSSLPVQRITFYPLSEKCDRYYEINHFSSSLQTIIGNYRNDEWFQSALDAGNQLLLSDVFNDDHPMFFAVRAIKDYDNNKIIGVLRIDTYADTVSQQVHTLHLTEHSFAALFNVNSGCFILSPRQELRNVENVNDLKNGDLITIDDETMRVFRKPIKTINWELFYFLSVKDTNLSATASILLIGGLCLITFLISFWIYQQRSARLVHSLHQITQTIHCYEQGDLDAFCQVEDGYEFQLIASALNAMGSKLKEHIQKECDALMEKQNAEYLALQSQVNPHFLNNTLNGLIGLNRSGEKKLLETSLLQLASMFRYTCKNDSCSTVKEEAAFVEQYLALQKLRFEERFDYRLNVAEDVLSFCIPKLLIQPIVENSIIHGMEPSENPVTIMVEAQKLQTVKMGSCLEIMITDDGIGFDASMLPAAKSRSVGIENIRQRVIRFHPQAVFELESAPGRGTQCRIRIPEKR